MFGELFNRTLKNKTRPLMEKMEPEPSMKRKPDPELTKIS